MKVSLTKICCPLIYQIWQQLLFEANQLVKILGENLVILHLIPFLKQFVVGCSQNCFTEAKEKWGKQVAQKHRKTAQIHKPLFSL